MAALEARTGAGHFGALTILERGARRLLSRIAEELKQAKVALL